MSDFKEGLYDQLVTRHVREFLDLQATQGLKSLVEELEENDYPDYLARHLIRQIKAVLRSVPPEDRKQRQIELANTLLDFARAQDHLHRNRCRRSGWPSPPRHLQRRDRSGAAPPLL